MTRAIRSSVKRIAEHDRALGRQLEATVKTGTFCSYRPAPGFEIAVAERPPAEEAAPAPERVAPEEAAAPAVELPSLIGRGPQLEQLERAFREASAGRGSLHLIGGEPGVGKTLLVDAFCEAARGQGALVLWGRCWEGGGAPAFWPWLQVIRAYLREEPGDDVLNRMGTAARYLAHLVPELGAQPAVPSPDGMQSEEARFALFDAVTTFLRNAGRKRPLVVALDDLHAADESSLLLLDFLAHELRTAEMVVVGTYRRGEAGRGTEELLGHLVAHAELVPLTGLAGSEVTGFIEQRTGVAAPVELAEAVHAATQGNPFFMEQVLRLLVSQGLLDRPDALLAERLPLPEGVREAIQTRLEPLGREVIGLLQVGAVLGKEFSLPALEQASEQPRERLLELLDEPESRGIICHVTGALARYRFVHALIREVLYDGLSASARIDLHRRVAAGLEALYAADPEAHYAQLAHHFLEAAPVGDVAKAVDYATRAGHRAMRVLAFEEAVAHYDSALQALELEQPSDPAVRCDLLLAAGSALMKAGDTGKGKETFRRAAEIARRLGAADKQAEAALGFAGRYWTAGVTDHATVSMLEGALAALGEEDSLMKAEVLGRLALELYYSPSRERAESLSEEAVEIARRVGDPGALAWVLDARLTAVWRPDNLDERFELATEVVELADRSGDAETALRGRAFRVTCLLERGDVAGADGEIEAASRLAQELRQPRFIWHTTALRALRALMSGRLEEGERLAGEALEAGRRADERGALQLYGTQLGFVRQFQGRVEEYEAPIKRFVEQFPALPAWRCVLAALYAQLGRESDARREFERAASHDWEDLPRDAAWLSAIGRAAEACAFLRDVDRAPELYELLLPYADRLIVNGRVANHSLGPVRRHLGLLAATMSRWEEAVDNFERALEMAVRTGERPWLAQTQLDYARALLTRAERGDRERAGELLDTALAAAEELSMVGIATKVESARGVAAQP